MAIGVLLDIPGGTREQYEEVNQRAFGDPKGPAEPPTGLILHTSGATSTGWRIFDVWESKQDFERFMEQYVMPAVDPALPRPPEPDVYELTNVIGGRVTAQTT